MSKSSAQAEGITMSGGGVYSLATRGAKDVINNAAPLVLEAAKSIPSQSFKSGFTLSDMGCADGGTSLEKIGNVLEAIRRDHPATPLSVVYTDQPHNDFNALVRSVPGVCAE
jgi:hypothetical protein